MYQFYFLSLLLKQYRRAMLTKYFHGIHCQAPKGDLEPVRGSIQALYNYRAILYKGH